MSVLLGEYQRVRGKRGEAGTYKIILQNYRAESKQEN